MKFVAQILVLTALLSVLPKELLSAQSASSSSPDARKTRPASSPTQRFERISAQAAQARDQNKSDEAVRLYREALQLKPSWAEGWWDLGTVLYEIDRYAEARDAFRRLSNLKPDGGAGWAMLGLCEFELRDYEVARRHLERAHTLGLGSNLALTSVAQYHLAILYTRYEQFEAAAKTVIGMAQQGSENPSLIEALGLSTLRLPFLPSEIPPDKREMVLLAGRAAFDMSMRRPADGQREFEELVTRFPETPNVHYAYGTFILISDPDAALREFNREIQVSTNHVAARLQIAFEYIKRTNYAPGLPYAEKAVELEPQLFAAHDALGRLLLGMGETARAVTELEAAVKLAPDSPEASFALSNAYARVGRKEDAARVRAEFMRLDKMRKN